MLCVYLVFVNFTSFSFPLARDGSMDLHTLYIGKNVEIILRYNGIFEACGRDGGIDTMEPCYPIVNNMSINLENKTFTYKDGMVFKDNGTTLFYIDYTEDWENGTIIIPEGVEKIECQIPGKYVILPSTLKALPDLHHKPAMFPYAQVVEISSKNEHFRTVDGVLFSSDMSTLWAYPYRKISDKYIVPAGVKNIYGDGKYVVKESGEWQIIDNEENTY